MTTASDDQTDRLGLVPAAKILTNPSLEECLAASRSLQEGTAELLAAAERELASERAARERIQERLDQFESYAITVASALDDRAAREAAERLLAECDDELENASCPPMTNETIPERIARLAGLVSSTARDEQTALEGKVAAESRLAEAEAVLREIADCQHRYVQTGYASEIHNESECGPCIASAFLAGGKS